jgi:hypothetical protein
VTTFAAVVVLTLAIAATTVVRMVKDETTPILFWLILVPATVSPMVSGWMALFPGPPASEAPLEPPNGRSTLTVPEGHDLIVSATIAPITPAQADNPEIQITNYVIKLAGGTWEQTLMGKIKRGSGSIVVSDGRDGKASLSSQAGGLTLLWGEDRQDRFRAEGLGVAQVWIGNWSGGAASAVSVQAVPGTPPRRVLLGMMAAFVGLAMLCDARFYTDRLTADFGVLSCASLFIAEQVTPDGGLRAILFTLGFAVIFGGILGKLLGAIAEAAIGVSRPEEEEEAVSD